MEKPTIAQNAPYKMELEAGTYWWCACGKSKDQPFCDGSHKTTSFTPVKLVIEDKRKISLCGCKQTLESPICDGMHKQLNEKETE